MQNIVRSRNNSQGSEIAKQNEIELPATPLSLIVEARNKITNQGRNNNLRKLKLEHTNSDSSTLRAESFGQLKSTGSEELFQNLQEKNQMTVGNNKDALNSSYNALDTQNSTTHSASHENINANNINIMEQIRNLPININHLYDDHMFDRDSPDSGYCKNVTDRSEKVDLLCKLMKNLLRGDDLRICV